MGGGGNRSPGLSGWHGQSSCAIAGARRPGLCAPVAAAATAAEEEAWAAAEEEGAWAAEAEEAAWTAAAAAACTALRLEECSM